MYFAHPNGEHGMLIQILESLCDLCVLCGKEPFLG
jgi:hypothetical protein